MTSGFQSSPTRGHVTTLVAYSILQQRGPCRSQKGAGLPDSVTPLSVTNSENLRGRSAVRSSPILRPGPTKEHAKKSEVIKQ
ncbi:hypothetical protein PoB_004749400 [Plakobranchus ocellatus]|uniref:Uncharacterized protein n=1 Tax=Plakobranchus ocellatus TaxID=259542 RepID=A0AAV4BLH2_9GAST|nr:hypothetical protein PoB_004749400 [Plakobranchus ocellatus]